MKTVEELALEAKKIVGENVPLTVERDGNKITSIKYQTEWKIGTTRPVETGELNDDGQPIYDYEEDYKDMKLTKAQISELDTWIKENVES
jgi:hypothetical protein